MTAQTSHHRESGELSLYIQTGLQQFFIGWPYSTGFYPPAKIIERRCKMMCTEGRPLDSSAKDMLCELHWLPVRKRVCYKLLLLTYKTLNGSVP